MERYLAVVYPITYVSLKKAKGIRIRNVTVCCFWLLGFTVASFTIIESRVIGIIFSCVLILEMIVISFCSLSVLRVLIRPMPRQGAGGREQVDQSKLRAFYTIMALLAGSGIRFCGNILNAFTFDSSVGDTAACRLWLSVFWFDIPCKLVLLLLFLKRTGRLPC